MNCMEHEPIAFLNGQMLPARAARLPVSDAGIVLGATVTEMIRTFRGRPFRLDEHLARFERSLRYVRFETGLSAGRWREVIAELVAHNFRLMDPADDLGIVLFVTAGDLPMYAGIRGVRPAAPTVCAHTFPLPWEVWSDTLQCGLHLVTPTIRHVPPQCLNPNMKCRSRMHYFLADQEARLVDPAAAALLLDLDGNVCETSNANFLIVERGTIVSPTLRNTLPGISRDVVVELAGKLGIAFIERDFQVFHVVNAEEAFVASTPICMLPVTRINGQPIGDGKPGRVFGRLLEAWSDLVGLDIAGQIMEGAGRRGVSA